MFFKMTLSIWLLAIVEMKCDEEMEKQKITLRLERVICKCEPTICSLKCNVKFISRDIANFNTNITLYKPLDYMKYRMQSFYKGSNNEYRPLILDIETEFCEAFAKKNSPMQDVLLKHVGPFSNINKPCPWNPGYLFVKDFNFGIRHVPFIVPEGRYILNMSFTGESNNFIVYYQVYFKITNYGVLDLHMG